MCLTGQLPRARHQGPARLHVRALRGVAPLPRAACPPHLRGVAVLIEPHERRREGRRAGVAHPAAPRLGAAHRASSWARGRWACSPRSAAAAARPGGDAGRARARRIVRERTAGRRRRASATSARAPTPVDDLRARRLGNLDVVFEATGATAVVLPAMRLLGPDGVCILSSVTPGRSQDARSTSRPGTGRWCSATAWCSAPSTPAAAALRGGRARPRAAGGARCPAGWTASSRGGCRFTDVATALRARPRATSRPSSGSTERAAHGPRTTSSQGHRHQPEGVLQLRDLRARRGRHRPRGLGGEVDPRGRAQLPRLVRRLPRRASCGWWAAASAPTATATSRTTPRGASASCCCTSSEICKLGGKATEKGYTIIPLKAYFKKGRVKVEIGLARGKKAHDKRESIKRKDIERDTPGRRVSGDRRRSRADAALVIAEAA